MKCFERVSRSGRSIARRATRNAWVALAIFVCVSPSRAADFVRGDVTGDQIVDVSDPIQILNCLLVGIDCTDCRDAADANDDGRNDFSDAVLLLRHIFVGAPPPPPPYPFCGDDPSLDGLDCRSSPTCAPVAGQTEVLVRTINIHGNSAPQLPIRLRGISQALYRDWPHEIGLIGLQEVKGGMTNCRTGAAETNGARCLAAELSELFGIPAEGRYSEGNQVGMVVGGSWRIISKKHWEIGGWFSRRYLLEAVLEHNTRGYRLRFYSTHLSNTSAGKRKDQASDVVKKVRERAQTGELPPIVVGDFNAGRTLGGEEDAEKSVRLMEEHFWRPVDAYFDGRTPFWTGIDLVYVGRKRSFPGSCGTFVPLRDHHIPMSGVPAEVEGFPDFHDELTDHDAKGFRFLIEGGIRWAGRKTTLGETSRDGPALATNGSRVLLGWVGTGNEKLNFLSSADGLNFGGKVTLGERSPHALALTQFAGRFVVAWVGVGNRRLNIMQSGDGRSWIAKVTLRDTSTSSPALAVLNGRLYLAWRGVGNNRLNLLRSGNGVNWSSKVTLGETTESGPALAALGDHLLLCWAGVGNRRLNVLKSADGRSFFGKTTLNETTRSSPHLLVHEATAYLLWQGVGNQHLNVLRSWSGTSWGNKVTLHETCIDRPVATTLGDDLVWGWTGTDSRHHLNTLLYNPCN